LPELGRVAVPAKTRAGADRKALSLALDVAKALMEGREDRAMRIALAHLGGQLKKEVGDEWSWLVDELVGRLSDWAMAVGGSSGAPRGVAGWRRATGGRRASRGRSGEDGDLGGGGSVGGILRGLLRLLESSRG
jgi:hypothetical protein